MIRGSWYYRCRGGALGGPGGASVHPRPCHDRGRRTLPSRPVGPSRLPVSRPRRTREQPPAERPTTPQRAGRMREAGGTIALEGCGNHSCRRRSRTVAGRPRAHGVASSRAHRSFGRFFRVGHDGLEDAATVGPQAENGPADLAGIIEHLSGASLLTILRTLQYAYGLDDEEAPTAEAVRRLWHWPAGIKSSRKSWLGCHGLISLNPLMGWRGEVPFPREQRGVYP